MHDEFTSYFGAAKLSKETNMTHLGMTQIETAEDVSIWNIALPARPPFQHERIVRNQVAMALADLYFDRNTFHGKKTGRNKLERMGATAFFVEKAGSNRRVEFHTEEDVRGTPSFGLTLFVPLHDKPNRKKEQADRNRTKDVSDVPLVFLLGSHLQSTSPFDGTGGAHRVNKVLAANEQLRPTMLPVLGPHVKRGDLLLIDSRLWHARLDTHMSYPYRSKDFHHLKEGL